MTSTSNFIKHIPCRECGSSDGNSLYDDGHTFCSVCSNHTQGENSRATRSQKLADTNSISSITPLADVYRGIPRRGLPEEAIRKYQIDVCLDKTQDVAHRYPYFKDGKHVANKIRKRTVKDFYNEGNIRDAELFGQNLFPPGSAKQITVVEGELDAASAYVLMGSRYPVVSVGNAGSALKDCKRNFEYLDSYDQIALCFDKDEAKVKPNGDLYYPGQEAAKKVAELFKPGKVRILTLAEGKDPNDYLQKGVAHASFVKEWWAAPTHKADGLISGKEMLDQLLNRPKHFTIPYPWENVNKMTYGIRLSELILLMADTGAGKTSVLKEIAYSILMNPDAKEKNYGVGFLHLEEPNYDTALGLLSIHNSKPYHLPDVERTSEEIVQAHSQVLGDGRAILYDSFGSNEIDTIISKVRHMAALGCKYIFLDHLSIIVSDQSGDERKQLDEISTKLKTLTIEQDLCVFCVIHTNRSGLARGSAGPEKVANLHVSLEREKKDPNEWRRNVLKLIIEKNRFCGRTGPCEWMEYLPATGRLKALDKDYIDMYEEGGSPNDANLSWQ